MMLIDIQVNDDNLETIDFEVNIFDLGLLQLQSILVFGKECGCIHFQRSAATRLAISISFEVYSNNYNKRTTSPWIKSSYVFVRVAEKFPSLLKKMRYTIFLSVASIVVGVYGRESLQPLRNVYR